MSEQAPAGSQESTPGGATFTTYTAADALRAKREAAANPEPVSEPAPEPDPVPETAPDSPEPASEGQDQTGEEEVDYNALLHGSSEDFEEAEEETDQSIRSFTLRHKGEERAVPEPEVISLAQKGLDYDANNREAVEARKRADEVVAAAEAERAKVREEREALAEAISAFTDKLSPPDPKLADPESPDYDPDAYTAQLARYNAQMSKAEQAAKELDEKRAEDDRQRNERINAAMDAHMARLQTRVPDMKNEKTANEVGKYLVALGFTRDDLFVAQRIHPADSRFLELAYKARRWDLSQANKKKLRPKPAKVASKGGSRRAQPKPKAADEAKDRLQRTGSRDDAVEALIARRKKAS